MEREIVNFYKQLYIGYGHFRSKLGGISFFSIPLDKSAFLETTFTIEEIRATVDSMYGDRALGPNGFPILFFQ